MKIALCFFGITRNLKRHTLDSIERFLLAVLARADPKYKRFAHFNLVEVITNARSGEYDVPVDTSDFKLLNCDAASHTDQAWLDRHLDYRRFAKFGDAQADNFGSLRNLVRQLYSLQQVTQVLTNANERFDLVIHSRADIRFEKPVEIPKVQPGTIYTPWFDKYRGLNDRFALGDYATMVTCGQRFSMIETYCLETSQPLHAERFLLWYANRHHIRKADLTSIEFSRVRANGQVVSVDTSARARLNYWLKRGLRALRLRQY